MAKMPTLDTDRSRKIAEILGLNPEEISVQGITLEISQGQAMARWEGQKLLTQDQLERIFAL